MGPNLFGNRSNCKLFINDSSNTAESSEEKVNYYENIDFDTQTYRKYSFDFKDDTNNFINILNNYYLKKLEIPKIICSFSYNPQHPTNSKDFAAGIRVTQLYLIIEYNTNEENNFLYKKENNN